MPGKSRALRATEEAKGLATIPDPSAPQVVYHRAFPKMAEDLAMLSATNDDIAAFFGVDVSSIERWQLEHPLFKAALQKGRQLADVRVARAQFRRALGMKITKERVVIVKGKPQIIEVKEELPPSESAGQFWLKNRQAAKWKDRSDVNHSGEISLSALVGAAAARLEQEPKTIEGSAEPTEEPLDVVNKAGSTEE